MDELSVRRNRGFAVSRYQGISKAEKQTGTDQTRPVAGQAAATVSETLRQLMTRVSQVQRHFQEARRTLQTGEASLAEVEDSLSRMEALARQAAEDSGADPAALQKSLEQLREEIDRIAQDGVEAGLFQDGEDGEGLAAVVDAVMEGLAARQSGAEKLPAWLLRGLLGTAPTREQLMTALGVDSGASGAQLLSALDRLFQANSPVADYLTAFYLGGVIAVGVPGTPDPDLAAQGLWRLLDMVSRGVSPDQAVETLTGGVFTSLADFQVQFAAGTAPGQEIFLTSLLKYSGELPALPEALTLAVGDGGELELLMDLLTALDSSEYGWMELLDGAAVSSGVHPQMERMEVPTLQVTGRDLSQARFDAESETLTVDASQDPILRGLKQGEQAPAFRLTGEGTVTLQQVETPLLRVETGQVRVLTVGENVLAQVSLGEGSVLTLNGSGLVRIGSLQGGASSVLRLAGGAAELAEEGTSAGAVTVVLDGPALLLAAAGTHVVNAQGEPLEPFDLLWKVMFPEWSAITALAVDGRQGPLALRTGGRLELARLWLERGDTSQGYPAHTVVLQGRDQAGQLQTRYVYVRWEERARCFQEVAMYPNPFTITGGEEETDWRYEEESHTLHILTGQVTAIAGGTGTDANQLPFSGRIILADGIGRVELILDGVACRVSSGGAFCLGRNNDVTLLLRRGTENVFESGPGYAGIALEEGTSLCIDQAKGNRELPDGTLTATGGSGGAGIGRSSGAGRKCAGAIRIRGGVIAAAGTGGGAGIGGALGAGVGEIHIQGGRVSAQAGCCAAAIGAGIQGSCGDITITGSARIVKAQGGGPDGDIGGCLFGSCGRVQVSVGTNLAGARLWTQQGLCLRMGENSVTLPRFRVSAQALRLDGLDLSTRATAWEAVAVLAADRRWVNRLQGAYGAMYSQLGQSVSSLYHAHLYTGVVRDAGQAGELMLDMREMLRQSPLAIFFAQQGKQEIGYLLR